VSWFTNIFEGKRIDPPKEPVRAEAEAPLAQALRAPETERIQTQNIDQWSRKLRLEGERTGNQRMITQAQNIRERWKLPPCND
jgi:hypothetical protein